jgi:outer membrane protein assembly factor BamB
MHRGTVPHGFVRALVLVLATLVVAGALPATTAADDDATPAGPPSPAASSVAPGGRGVPTLAGDPGRTGDMPGPGPTASPVVRWQAETGASELSPDAFPFVITYPFFVNQEPAIMGGTVFAPGTGGGLVAIDATTGAERWRLPAEGGELASPTFVDGVVYAGRLDGTFLALDAATGTVRWTAVIGEDVSPINSPAVVDGTVYVGTVDGAVLALEAATGKERWRVEEPGEHPVGSPAVTGGVVYALRPDGSLQALDAATGRERWRFRTVAPQGDGGFFDIFTAYPAVADGLVVFGGPDAAVHAVDASTGDERWRLRIGLAGLSSPALVDGVVYVAAGGSYVAGFPLLYALDATTGDVRWAVVTDGLHTPPTVADGTVYAGSADLTLSTFDTATGAERWRLALVPGAFDAYDVAAVHTAPAVVDGTVYVGAQRSVSDPESRLVSEVFAVGGAAGRAAGSGHGDDSGTLGTSPPEDCLVAPLDAAAFLALVAGPEEAMDQADAAPVATPADADAALGAIEATARRFVACANADDVLRLLALMSPELAGRIFDVEPEEALALFAVLSAPHAPSPRETWVEFVGVDEARALPDGRILAVVVVRDADGREHRLGPWVFARVGARWLVDSFEGEAVEGELGAGEWGGPA